MIISHEGNDRENKIKNISKPRRRNGRELSKDPAFATEYLNSILEDGDQEELMLARRRISKVFGGVQKLAGQRSYRTVSLKNDPEL